MAWARVRGANRFKAFRIRNEEGIRFAHVWARLQGATNRAIGFLRLTPRQVAPPEVNVDGPSSARITVVTRMALAQDSARRLQEFDRLRRTYRSRMCLAIEKPNSSFNLLMIGTVSLSVLLFILETEASIVCLLGHTGRTTWFWIEALCIGLFTAEILARLGLVITEPDTSWYNRGAGSLRMLCQPMTLIDIAALVPFYTGLYLIASGIQEATAAVELCTANATSTSSLEASQNNLAFLAFLRVFRLARVFRVLRLARRMCAASRVAVRAGAPYSPEPKPSTKRSPSSDP